MNWKNLKKEWQAAGDERWNQHPKGHLAQKKAKRQNRKEGRLR